LGTNNKASQELRDFDKVFKALAHPTRRNVLTILIAREKLNAGDIVKYFDHKWPTITRHLKQLEDAGLIILSKIGTQHFYALNTERMRSVLNNWLKWF